MNKFLKFLKSFGWAIAIAFVFRFLVASPYKIPTGSMLPTLQIGDYIFVNKMAYGLRLILAPTKFELFGFPITVFPFYVNVNFMDFDKPQRGDVIVFVYPVDNQFDYIKRVVAIEGDTVLLQNSELYINGKKMPRESVDNIDSSLLGRGNVIDVYKENIGGTSHLGMEESIAAPDERDNFPPQDFIQSLFDDKGYKIPKDHIFVIGDNRDNSLDSRYWGPVPLENVRGRASFIWLSRIEGPYRPKKGSPSTWIRPERSGMIIR